MRIRLSLPWWKDTFLPLPFLENLVSVLLRMSAGFSSVDGTITCKKGSSRWYFAATLPGFKAKLLYMLAVGFWAPLCSFLSLNFLNCEMGL